MRRAAATAFVALLAVYGTTGCPPRGTGLRVEVDGPTTPPFDALERFDVTVTPSRDNETTALPVAPEDGGTFGLPTSFVLALRSPEPGPVTVCLTAIASGAAVGSGCGSGTVERGRTTTVAVTITAATCGNGVIDPLTEDCDATDLGGATCASLGVGMGTLACAADCSWDTSGCVPVQSCGDGLVNGPEQCDGVNLDGNDCTSVGCAAGTLACTTGCLFDTAACTGCAAGCGNGLCDGVETSCDCPGDCGSPMGDGVCNCGETCGVDADCSPCCGDATCDATETSCTCAPDCGSAVS
ncbi:MAG TPA: hypothetical protein VG389_28750, partial [Myxococcota bacterium]|nr:hypothetical protein [Myxococcota bacterium]